MADANPYIDPKFAPDPPKGGAPRPPPVGIGQARRGGGGTPEGLKQGVRNVQDWYEWATQNPLARGVGSVLGTTERAGVSGESWLLDKLAGKKPTTNPVAGVLDPEGDVPATHRLEQQEASWTDQHVPGMREARAANARLPQADPGLSQGILDFMTQSGRDISTFVPGWDVLSLGSRALRMAGAYRALGAGGRAIGGALPEGVRKAAAAANENIRSTFTTSHDPLKGMQQSGLNITRSHEGGARHLQAKREAEYAPVADRQTTLAQLGQTLKTHGLTGQDITSRNPLGIHNAINHIPLHQRLALHQENKLTDAALWREGSPQAHGQMRARGYTPSAEDAALPNANLVQGDYGRRYIPEQSIPDAEVAAEADAARGFSISRGGVKRSRHDVAKHGGPQHLAPLDERFANRLQSSAYLEPKRRAEQNIIRDLGLTPTQVGKTDARITDLQQRLALTPKGTPEHDLLAKHVEKYKALHQRQTAAAYKDSLLREKHLVPGGSIADTKNEALRQQLAQTPLDHPDREALEQAVADHKNPLSGILRGKKTAERSAARDVAFHGGDASAAFNEHGKALGQVSTGASGEKYRQRLLAATGAETRKTTTNAALRDLDTRLSKMGLKQQQRVTKKIADLRARQAMRERRNLASLENIAKPKVKPEPETPNIFDLPHLSNRKLTHEIPKSSPIMQRIAELRDERARRGGKEFAPLLHSLPTDTTKATGRVHRLADRAARDAALKHSSFDTAAAGYAADLARNKAVSKITKGVEADPLYQGNVEMPSPLHDRLFGPKVYEPPLWPEHVANFAKHLMFLNPLPHGGENVPGQQIFAGGGLGTAARGVAEAVKIARKDPEALKRLDFTKQHGAIHEHGYEKHIPGENIAAKAYRATQRPLTISGEGQASALMHKYLHEGMTPEDAAEEVRKTFGHPHESSKFSKAGKRFGAPFAKWVFETVPTAAKKMATSPHSRNALKQFARADVDANADIFEPEYGVEWRPGGFADKAAELAIKPASYFSGPSVTPSMQEEGEEGKRGVWDAVKGYVPYSSLLEMGKQPLTPMQRARGGYADLPAWAKAMQPVGSSFKRAETPLHILQRELKREGLTRPSL
jgi:hypothetical protein